MPLLHAWRAQPLRVKAARCFAACLACAWVAGVQLAPPTSHAFPPPNHPSTAICAVIKDDPAYVTEWVEYHLWLGVDRLYILDDASPVPLARVLSPFVAAGRVAMMTPPVLPNVTRTSYADSPQGRGYNACIQHACAQHDYMAFIDSDEFIIVEDGEGQEVSMRPSRGGARWAWRALTHRALAHHRRNQTPHLGAFLARHFTTSHTSGILLNWVVFAGGHARRPSGGILRNYQNCLPANHTKSHAVKTLANCAYVTGSDNPHTLVYGRAPAGAREVDEWGQPATHDGTYTRDASHTRLFLHHYMFKSADDAAVKLRVGAGSGMKKSEAYYRGILADATQTCSGARELAGRCCPSTACLSLPLKCSKSFY